MTKKGERAEPIQAYFNNEAGVPLHIFWLSFEGEEKEMGTLHPGEELTLTTGNNHIFNLRTVKSGLLVHSLEIQPPQLVRAIARPCTGMSQDELGLDSSRWPEFEQLATGAQTPCQGEDSSKWSCVRQVSQEEVDARDPKLYGFSAEEAEGSPYSPGATKDHIHTQQQSYIPNVTHYDGGYVKMRMTDKLMELLEFYKTRQQHMGEHGIVPGFFTNTHKVTYEQINIDHFPQMQRAVIDEMREVLQWWTQQNLKHTVTFGIRVYRRDAVLINHLDRKQSHLASAILQVHQEVDKDGGWPVELIHPHRSGVTEVYLQPGEMLLYEGARIEHGRPMRFRGKEFANLFSHFVPTTYRGPDQGWRNPHLNEL